jgi:hypothetical protein
MRLTVTTLMSSWNCSLRTRYSTLRGQHPWGQRLIGKAQVREGLAGRFKGLPDVHYGEGRHFVSGNMGFSEWTVTATTPVGVRVEVRGTDHYEFLDGKVIRKDSYWKIVEK